jgi:hypothetical protein
MTLPSSGSISWAQIQTEIGSSGSMNIPDANTRTLTGKSTGSLFVPTDFYGKTWDTGGGGLPLSVSVTPSTSSTSGTPSDKSVTFTATPSNNTAAVSFAWSVTPIDGSASIPGSTTSATASVTVTVNDATGLAQCDVKCTITQGANTAQDTASMSYEDIDWADGNPTCVMWDTWLPGIGIAEFATVGSEIMIGDPVTGQTNIATISRADKAREPCVRIMTRMGVSLDCSTSAPIATEGGGQVLAPNLMGHKIPVKINDVWEIDEIVSIVPIGMQTVINISCDNNFFFAGREIDRYMLHHNIKNS